MIASPDVTTLDPDTSLAEALSLGPDEAERAEALLRRVSEIPPCKAWAEARLELARRAFGAAEFSMAEHFTRSVLDAPPHMIPNVSRAVAGVLMSESQEMMEQQLNEEILKDSIEGCALERPYYAAAGLGLLATRHLLAGDRMSARRSLERATHLFDRAGSMLGGPTALGRLARLAIEDGRLDDARACLDRGISHLETFPYAGLQVRGLQKKLRELRATLNNG